MNLAKINKVHIAKVGIPKIGIPIIGYKSDKQEPIITYTDLLYIESTGTQYIDSGVPSGNNVGIYCKFKSFDKLGGDTVVMGATGDSTESKFWINTWNDSILFGFGYNVHSRIYSIYKKREVCINYLNDRTSSIDKTLYEHNITNSLPSGNYNNILICTGLNKSGTYFNTNARIYEAKITVDDVVVRHFVPKVRDNDGAIGLYDLINNEFYTNVGQGEFIAGHSENDVYVVTSPLTVTQTQEQSYPTIGGTFKVQGYNVNVSFNNRPIKFYLDEQCTQPYTPSVNNTYSDRTYYAVTYIEGLEPIKVQVTQPGIEVTYTNVVALESTGTQYINLGVLMTPNTGIYADFLTVTNLDGIIMGGRGETGSFTNLWINPMPMSNTYNLLSIGYGTTINFTNIRPIYNRVKVSVNLNNDKRIIYNGNYIRQNLYNFVEHEEYELMYLFSANIDGKDKYYTKSCLYEAIVTYGDDIVRHLKPVVRDYDNTPGMLDIINNVFYTNNGNGNFIVHTTDPQKPLVITEPFTVTQAQDEEAPTITGKYKMEGRTVEAPFDKQVVSFYSDEACTIPYTPSINDTLQNIIYYAKTNVIDLDPIIVKVVQPGLVAEFEDIYEELFAIQSIGNSYIDTEYEVTNAPTKFTYVANWAKVNNISKLDNYIVSSFNRQGTGDIKRNAICNGLQYGSYFEGSSYEGVIKDDTYYKVDHEISNEGARYSLNNMQINSISINDDDVSGETIYIFFNNYDASIQSGIIKYLKIEENGVLVRDMIPVRRTYDNAIGMYDRVTERFFENKGTAPFIIVQAPQIDTTLPAEYTELEAIQSTANAYIRPNFTAQIGNLVTECKAAVLGNSSRIFGTTNGSTYDIEFFALNGNLQVYTHPSCLITKTYDTEPHIYKFNCGGYNSVDDNAIATKRAWAPDATTCVFITAYDNSTLAGNYGCKMYYFKYYQVYEDEIYKAWLVPVIKTTTNEVGMFDLVNKQFYTNQGGGSFTPIYK